MDDLIELELPAQRPTTECPRCIKKHICRPEFTLPIFQQSDRIIAKITYESPEEEKRICERISQASRSCKSYHKTVLRKNHWKQNLQVFLLIRNEEIIAYIVMEHQVILDIYTMPNKRGKGHMRFLLLNTLSFLGLSFERVCFKKPLTDFQFGFLGKMSEETGLTFKTC